MKNLICCTLACAVCLSLSASTIAQEKKGVAWLGSGLSYEFKPSPNNNMSLALGFSAFVKDDGFGSSTMVVGPMVEALRYSTKDKMEGFAYGARAGTADGETYFAPSIMFTGKGKNIVGRGGVFFPMGSSRISPIGVELAIGIRL